MDVVQIWSEDWMGVVHYTLHILCPTRSAIRQKHKIFHLYSALCNETMCFVCFILIVLRFACHVIYSAIVFFFSFESICFLILCPSKNTKRRRNIKKNNRKMEINVWKGVNFEWVFGKASELRYTSCWLLIKLFSFRFVHLNRVWKHHCLYKIS